MVQQIPDFNDVAKAAERLAGHAVKTPLLNFPVLDAITGARVFIKPESLQRTGSFKFRGAYNALSNLAAEDLQSGIVASSSGNHAQGVAAAAAMFGAAATIIMPSDAPKLKTSRTRALGAGIVFYDRATESREAAAEAHLEKHGGVFVHPFDNFHVIAGQGTVGLEIAGDMNAAGTKPDRVLVCTGGGGLTAGVSLSISHFFPEALIHTVEPEGFDDYRRSLESGERETNARTTGSVCDAIVTPQPGAIGFEINRKRIRQGLVVSDEEALQAVGFAYRELKLVAEPGGAVALAALLGAGKNWAGETVVVVVSGGNVDPDVFARAIQS